MEVSGQLYCSAALLLRKEPLVPIVLEAGWAPELWRGELLDSACPSSYISYETITVNFNKHWNIILPFNFIEFDFHVLTINRQAYTLKESWLHDFEIT
jgi:hypothetical protein